ncbi:MAG: ribonuclease D, partial [Paracoccaceae bacterium]|nr:ribonuclease D [Paracoccaceae bacterium]
LLRDGRRADVAEGILAAVAAGLEVKPEDFPKADTRREQLQVNPALADLLRVLLKAKSEGAGVAQKLIASSGDLDALAAGERSVPALKGWRGEVFGSDAIRLCKGEIALSAKGGSVRVVQV